MRVALDPILACTSSELPYRGPQLRSVKICHLSTIPTLTARIFYRECVHMAELGHQVCLICPGEKTRTTQGVQVVGYRRGEGSFGRTMVSPLALRPALKQKADIYHLHS